MKLYAKVMVDDVGQTLHEVGEIQSDGSTIGKNLSVASSLEIVEDSAGIYLLRYDSEGVCGGDTWHETIEEAKKQAAFEYGIHEEDWIAVKGEGE